MVMFMEMGEGEDGRCGDEDFGGDVVGGGGGDDAVDRTCHLQAPAVRQPIKV